MVKRNPFPEDGERVVDTVRQVQNFGALMTLDQYPGKEVTMAWRKPLGLKAIPRPE